MKMLGPLLRTEKNVHLWTTATNHMNMIFDQKNLHIDRSFFGSYGTHAMKILRPWVFVCVRDAGLRGNQITVELEKLYFYRQKLLRSPFLFFFLSTDNLICGSHTLATQAVRTAKMCSLTLTFMLEPWLRLNALQSILYNHNFLLLVAMIPLCGFMIIECWNHIVYLIRRNHATAVQMMLNFLPDVCSILLRAICLRS